MASSGPPFQPPTEYLSSLAAEISKATTEYASTPSPDGLQKIISRTQELNIAATNPMDRLLQIVFQSHVNATIRVAIGMKLFHNLPSDPAESIGLSELASRCNSTSEFTLRIARALVAHSLIKSAERETYSHTPMSRVLATVPHAQDTIIHMFDVQTHAMTQFDRYFSQYGYISPTDPKNSPAVFARGDKDMTIFESLAKEPERVATFNRVMAAATALVGSIAAKMYPFGELSEEGKTVLVDIGGGKGQTLQEIRKTYPQMKGRMVLQDLKHVLDEGMLVGENEVELCPYNFFEEVQPIKGAKAYFLKWVLHDWPDDSCRTILRNLKPAMRGHDSRLLICETVLEDDKLSPTNVMRDINMLAIGGKERSVKQWEELLRSENFGIEKFHGLDGKMSAVIEARLKEA